MCLVDYFFLATMESLFVYIFNGASLVRDLFSAFSVILPNFCAKLKWGKLLGETKVD